MASTNADEFLTAFLRQSGLAAPDETPAYTALAGGVSSDIWRAGRSASSAPWPS